MKHTPEKISSEQVHLLFTDSVLPIFFTIPIGALLCWSLWTVIEQTVLTAWFSLFLTISLARIGLIFLFKKQKTEDRAKEQWYWFFLIGTYTIAVVWGSASFFLFPEHSLSHQVVFIMIIIGMAAGGMASLSPSFPVIWGFLSLVLIPLAIRLMLLGNEEAKFKGSLILLFWAILLFGAVKISSNLRENIQLRLKSINRERKLRVSEERYRHIFSNVPLGIFHYDAEGVVVDCNTEFINIIGGSKESMIGFNMLDRLKDRQMLGAIKDSLITGKGYYEGDYGSVVANKTTPVRAFFRAIHSSKNAIIGGVSIIEDFTEKKLSDKLIQHHASYDSLSGLPNRRLLLEQLGNEIARARRHGHYGAILFIDLDNFKTVNDSLGHSTGDKLLKIVANRITERIRREDTAARMGGDEFVIIVTDLGNSIGLAAHKAREIAEEISLYISSPCQIDDRDLQITLSLGISLFPKGDKGVDDILKQADTAMYRAKDAGRNTINFFLPKMQEAADERLHLNTEIRKALDNDQLALHYQPQVDIKGKFLGAEALLRWHHPERGIILPEAFLEIAEESGLVHDIGQWVLLEACKQIKKWTDGGKLRNSQIISINISGKEIAISNFVDTVTSVLEKTGADPNHLGIELTEGSLISTGKDIVEKIMTLQRMGIKFAVDDFGTGYSSLSSLKSLPLNTIKIDHSFVNDIKDASHDVVLVDTIIMMAHNLGLEVIAEGVETEQEVLYLNKRGCIVYQGYYFSKAVTVTAFEEILKSGGSDGSDRG